MDDLGAMSRAGLIEVMTELNRQYARLQRVEDLQRQAMTELDKTGTYGAYCLILGVLGGVACMLGILVVLAASGDSDAAIFGWVLLTVAALLLVSSLTQYRKRMLRLAGPDIELRNHLARLQTEHDRIEAAMRPLAWRFPVSCRGAEANAYMLQMLICGRARCFADAASQWEAYAHRRSMEESERLRVQEARRQTVMMCLIAAVEISRAIGQQRLIREQSELSALTGGQGDR
ncbi:hypothetical protein [Bifidobacterium miconisargentati]|uniref:hypothetical protein n=1 Tax=Bifidobacterium miconisargentati TaxID=2834437 RepID=UPI001BDD386B|nr:hypothetical protein [Bifidobacterium miconisargentati]MBW3090078.1 hypothetical protein [Bifidobacterium miconisargentati]